MFVGHGKRYQAEQVAIVSDVLPILAAGTPNCCGIALIAGTGSIAFGRTADGRTKRCGGWGYLLGDEGSGYSVGRSALSHALRELESECLWQPNSLTEVDAEELNGKTSVVELTKAVYTSDDPRSFIASLAPVVAAAAEQGDKKGGDDSRLGGNRTGRIGCPNGRFDRSAARSQSRWQ